MSRSIVIPTLMLVIAASLGFIMFYGLGLSLLEASLSASCAFFIMAFFNLMVTSRREKDDVYDDIALKDIRNSVEALRTDVGELGQGMGHLRENARDRQEMEARMSAELRIVETLIKQLAEVVARVEVQAALPRAGGHHGALQGSQQAHIGHARGEGAEPNLNGNGAGGHAPSSAPQSALGGEFPLDEGGYSAQGEPDQYGRREGFILPKRAGTGRFDHLDDAEMLKLVRGSVHANRVDLYLQPIVTLPQRKVRYYEALTRLRSEQGEVILPADYMPVAEPAGVMPLIDNILLFRCVQVIKRLSGRNREAGVFCNISLHSLVDSEFFSDFVGYLRQNKELSGAIIFEFGQSTFESITDVEEQNLRLLAEMGYRFSMDKVRKLNINPKRLAARGFKFVKIPADLLMESDDDLDIHPADLGPLLTRHGIEMIVERVETEAMVVDLLDYNVSFGQGYLFSAPRPVRAEILGEQGSDR